MGFWTAIVTIVVIACVTGIILSYIDARKSRDHGREDLETRIAELDSELRERIQTLERIATDERGDLQRQLDDLERRA